MKNLITGSILFVLGITLYLCYNYFAGDGSSYFGTFSDGVLLGLAIGILLVGVMLVRIGLRKRWKKKEKKKKGEKEGRKKNEEATRP